MRRLGLGAMRLTGTRPFHDGAPRDPATALRVVRRALQLGVDHVDTAAFYFSSRVSANQVLATALSTAPEVTVATKVGPARDRDGRWTEPAGPDQLRGQVEENLRQLGRDRLDLVYLRVSDPGSLAERLGVLRDLVTEGLIGHLGVSGVSLEQLDEARSTAPVVAVQNRLAPDLPGDLDVLERCGELGIAFVPFFSVAGAGRHHGPVQADPVVAAVAGRHGVTDAQVRIAWTLALGPHVLAIPGTGDLRHLEQNVAAASVRLTDADLRDLATEQRVVAR
ncbi:aldo/keto reductase [Nocardioides mangrovi]|uniref:Aldo/keto reductase n=1 Tax=Nocardioides mangrovi TaxID=2874580 RepID=A0ABS7UJ98_9ACTN|nr:aldo/keto reductase [Nocardioides mangrovi]MBZ5741113.1 aldo/keto reductase [Nocardioides mangrovi]